LKKKKVFTVAKSSTSQYVLKKATNAVATRLLDCWDRQEGPTPHGRTSQRGRSAVGENVALKAKSVSDTTQLAIPPTQQKKGGRELTLDERAKTEKRQRRLLSSLLATLGTPTKRALFDATIKWQVVEFVS